MKNIVTVIALGIWIHPLLAQIPAKENILDGYYIGHKVFEAIETNNHDLIGLYFSDTTNIKVVQEVLNSAETSAQGEVNITKDVMYNQQSKKFEFVVYAGKYVPTKDEWGLFDYLFVIQMEIDLSQNEIENQVLNALIIDGADMSKLKIWWRNYMETYRQKEIYAKKEIADNYGLVPPPPPPPESEDWF